MLPGLLASMTLIVVAEPARAAVCTSTASFSWAGIGTGSWSCGPGTSADTYVVSTDHDVVVTADVTQADSATAGITVAPGGRLTVQGSLTLRIGGAGLYCEAGSTCVLEGAGFHPVDGTVSLAGEITKNARFHVGEVVLCPDAHGASACGAGGFDHVLRIRLSSGAPPGAAAFAPGDVLCFGDADAYDATSRPDEGACYEIVLASVATDPAFIDIDVRQSPSGRDAAGYPLAWRLLRRAEVRTPGGVEAGGREVHVGGAVLAESHQLVGRFLRFADDDGQPERKSYKIMATIDGGAGEDVLTIGAIEGFDRPHAQGRALWVDYGVGPGDPFFVYSPLRLRSATAIETDSQLRVGGTLVARRLVLDGLGAPTNGSSGTGALLLEASAVVETIEDLWIADPASPPGGCALMSHTAEPLEIRRLQQTGGTSSAANCVPHQAECADYLHGIGLGHSTIATFEGVNVRHHGDDVFVNVPGGPIHLTVRRLHAAFVSRHAASGNLFDLGHRETTLDARDVVCDDCTSPPQGASQAGPLVTGFSRAGGEIHNLLAWGTRGDVSCEGLVECENIVAIGSRGERGYFSGARSRNVLVRDVHFTSKASGIAPSSLPLRLERALIRDSSFGNQQGMNYPAVPDAPLEIEDVVFLDVDGPPVSFLLNGGTPASEVRVERVSALWTGPHTTDRFLSAYTTSTPGITVDRILVQGLGGVGEVALGLPLGSVESGGPSCFFDNALPWFAAQAPFVPGDWMVAAGLPPTSSPRLPSYPWNDRGCGAQGVVGIPGRLWLHAKSGLEPELLGDADGDGILAPEDLCAVDWDPAQSDRDRDGIGDACDVACGGNRITAVDEVTPSTGFAGATVELRGDGFGPAAEVYFGSERAAVVQRAPALRAVVPPLPVGTSAEVNVVNPEGCRSQAGGLFTMTEIREGSCGLLGFEALLLLALRRRPSRGSRRARSPLDMKFR